MNILLCMESGDKTKKRPTYARHNSRTVQNWWRMLISVSYLRYSNIWSVFFLFNSKTQQVTGEMIV